MQKTSSSNIIPHSMTREAFFEFFKQIDFKRIVYVVWQALSPLVYLSVWYYFVKFSFDNLLFPDFNPDLFLFLSFLILVFSLITKSTSWSIGHTSFGIKGDSRTRLLNYHKGDSGDSWFDLFGDNPELLKNEEIKALIKDLTDSTATA